MKLKHILLFFVCCLLLYLSDIYAGALIALGLFFQLNLLIQKIDLTKTSQILAFKLFLVSIPLFFFLGGVHSMMSLYIDEKQILFFIFAALINFILCFGAVFLALFVFHFLESSEFNLALVYQSAFHAIKANKKPLFFQSSAVFILLLMPFLSSDWRIIFALTATQFYWHRHQLKPAAWS